jgi:hypothetical protein
MDIKDLYDIRAELERFQAKLEVAVKKAENNKGHTIGTSKELYGVGNITGTKEAGSLKRAALDLKRLLTEKL